MGAPDTAARSDPQPQLGQRLKEARTAAGLSLVEVARETQLSASFLSMVENGISDIAIGRLLRLTQYYGIDIGELLGQPAEETVEPMPSPRTERLEWPDEGLSIDFLAPAHRPLRPTLAHFKPGGGMTEPLRGAGDAFLFVVSGRIEIELDQSENVVLDRGQSLYVSGTRSRLYRNVADGPTELLTVVLAT